MGFTVPVFSELPIDSGLLFLAGPSTLAPSWILAELSYNLSECFPGLMLRLAFHAQPAWPIATHTAIF